MVDLGLKKVDDNTKNYKTKFLSEIKPGEEIEGELHIGDIKKRLINNREVNEFFAIITNHEREEKWICGFVTSYYPEKGNIYGAKEGRVYTLIDSLNHVLNNSPRNVEDSYSVKFDVFKENINKEVKMIKVKAVQSWKPGAKSVNLEVIDAKLDENENSPINNLADSNETIKYAYLSLENKKKDIDKKSIAFELKLLLDKKTINRVQFKDALKELDNL